MMKSETGNFVKGLVAGAVVGIGVSMAVSPPEKGNVKKLEQRTGRALSAVGTILENFVNYAK